MKNFSNKYIFLFSTVMVVVVAVILAFLANKLKAPQEANVRIEKIQNILTSVSIESTKGNAPELFKKYITESYVLDLDGNKRNGIDAFNVDLKVQQGLIEKIRNLKGKLEEKRRSPFSKFLSKDGKKVDVGAIKANIKTIGSERNLPVYVCSHENGNTYYILPMRGKGLWGPVWGYVALENDLNTIYGTVFDHSKETPGLGAEITESWFEKSFVGKRLFDDQQNFKSVQVVKSGSGKEPLHNVDAITGGTITSKGLEAMVFDCLEAYVPFMTKNRK